MIAVDFSEKKRKLIFFPYVTSVDERRRN